MDARARARVCVCVCVCVVGALCGARVGIGLDSNTMVGTAGAVIGAPADGSVRRYNLTATSAAGVVPASVQDLTNTSVSTVGGNTVVTFTMPLPAQPAGTTPLVFAYGAGGSLSSSGEADNGATSVDFTAQPGCDAATSCRGHGACNGTRCVCDTGYVGIDCGVCDVGFKRTSGQVSPWLLSLLLLLFFVVVVFCFCCCCCGGGGGAAAACCLLAACRMLAGDGVAGSGVAMDHMATDPALRGCFVSLFFFLSLFFNAAEPVRCVLQ